MSCIGNYLGLLANLVASMLSLSSLVVGTFVNWLGKLVCAVVFCKSPGMLRNLVRILRYSLVGCESLLDLAYSALPLTGGNCWDMSLLFDFGPFEVDTCWFLFLLLNWPGISPFTGFELVTDYGKYPMLLVLYPSFIFKAGGCLLSSLWLLIAPWLINYCWWLFRE